MTQLIEKPQSGHAIVTEPHAAGPLHSRDRIDFWPLFWPFFWDPPIGLTIFWPPPWKSSFFDPFFDGPGIDDFWPQTMIFDPPPESMIFDPNLVCTMWSDWCRLPPPSVSVPILMIPVPVPTFLDIRDRHQIRHLMVTNPVQMSHHHPDGISPSDTSKPVARQSGNWTSVPSVTSPVSMWLATHYDPSMIRLKKVTTGVPGASKRSYLSGKTHTNDQKWIM